MNGEPDALLLDVVLAIFVVISYACIFIICISAFEPPGGFKWWRKRKD